MVKDITTDIFTAPIDVLAHQANCFHTMGAGIARHIREKFPEAYEADCKTVKDETKLGTYSACKVTTKNPNKQLKFIANVYSQGDYGRQARFTDYEAVAKGLTLLRDNLVKKGIKTLGVPWKYGCNIAGGDWNVVRAIIVSVFENSLVDVLICKHPDAENLNKSILGQPQTPK